MPWHDAQLAAYSCAPSWRSGRFASFDGRVTPLGRYLDSLCDLFVDAALFAGLAWYSGSAALAVVGFLALTALLAEESRATHFAPRARNVIFLYMDGGPSQVDTFDYKPLLRRDDGKPLPIARPRVVSSETGHLLRSPWGLSNRANSWL